MDVKITVSGKGGHSSVPYEHTTIGQLAQIIELIEKNPWEPQLSTNSRSLPPPLTYLSDSILRNITMSGSTFNQHVQNS